MAAATTFTQKKINLIFTLSNSTFAGPAGNNVVTVAGLRVSCKIVKSGSAQMNECQLRIFGLLPSVYNALTAIYPVTNGIQQNTVQVLAGDSSGMSQVFTGQITIAQIDLNQQPDAVMNVIAQSSLLQALQPIPATSYPSTFDVATAMQALATAMNLKLENNNVQVTLPRMTLNGTGRQQAITLAEAAGITYAFDDSYLYIYPKNGSRSTPSPITISAANGMIGYPSYSNVGIGLKTIYNPALEWGRQVQVSSSLKVASLNGLWTVSNVVHTLESELPDGRWDTELQAYNLQSIAP